MREFWQSFLEAWQTVNFKYELIDAGDHVVGLIDQRLRGPATGIELPAKYVQVFTFRDGLITRLKLYPRKETRFEPQGCGSRRFRRRTSSWFGGSFGKLMRIPYEPLHRFFRSIGASYRPRGAYPEPWVIEDTQAPVVGGADEESLLEDEPSSS
jgi:hypothetical protein